MGQLISAKRARELFGVSRSALKAWEAQGLLAPRGRTPGGQRRYDADDLARLVGEGSPRAPIARAPAFDPPPSHEAAPRPMRPIEDQVPPWEREVEWAKAGLTVDQVKRERLALRREVREEREQREREERRAAEQAERDAVEQKRLGAFKEHGRTLAGFAPPEWQARVVRELEEYVTTAQFPVDLPQLQAEQFVRAKVQAVLGEWRAEQAAAAEKRREEDRRQLLIFGGNLYAQRQTPVWALSDEGWEREDAEQARREVAAELERRVGPDWTEDQVRELVDSILDEWVVEE